MTHPDGSTGKADDGDGKGCADAGVAASQNQSSGTTNSEDDRRDIQAQEFDFNGTTDTMSTEESDTNFGPFGKGAQVLQAAGQRATHDVDCAGLAARV